MHKGSLKLIVFFKNLLFVLIFLCSSSIVYSQTSETITTIIDSNLVTKEKECKIDSLITKLSSQKKLEDLDLSYTNYIRWLYRESLFKKSIKIIKEALGNQKKIEFSNLKSHHLKLHYLGLSYYELQQYDLSIVAYNKIVKSGEKDDIAGRSYTELGRCYQNKGDYHRAIKYFKLGQSVLIANNSSYVLLANYINITTPYLQLSTLEAYEQSLKYFLKADSLAQDIDASDYYKYYIKVGLGESFNRDKTLDIEKGLAYYNQALEIAQRNKDSVQIAEVYNHLGNLYNTTDPNIAITYQLKANNFTHHTDTIQLSSNYGHLAICFKSKKNFNESLVNCYKAISLLLGSEINEIEPDNAFLFYNSPYKDYLFGELKELADIYSKRYITSKDVIDVKNTLKILSIADQLLDLILIESQEFQSKLFWRKQSSELYGKAIEACFSTKNAEKAFYFIEKNKSLLLTEELRNQQLKQNLSIPDSLIYREIELKKQIYNLEKQELLGSNKNSKTSKLLAEKRKLEILQDTIQEQFSNYRKFNFDNTIIELKRLQNSLKEDEVVLEYNINQYDDYAKITPENKYTPVIEESEYGKKTIHGAYILSITKDTVAFFKIEDAEVLKKDFKKLLPIISRPFGTEENIENYKVLSQGIFEKLFPNEIINTLKDRKLRIIPDNYLNYLPFEALVVSEINDNPKYLIEDNEISYCYSNTFLAQLSDTKKTSSLSYSGFAPVNFDKLTQLENSTAEIKNISNYFSGVNYSFEKATKSKFLSELPKYDLIHLATHADAQDSIAPWIAFTDEKLNLEELYFNKNNAKLVVLSGCNTLQGKQETGEGVMSLSRGFFHSGAQSVVSSLWSIDDRSTITIMDSFYKNLKEGKSKSAALRDAKLHYIKNHSLSEASPFYWASFVLSGDNSSLSVQSRFSKCWLLLILLPFIFFGFKKFLK